MNAEIKQKWLTALRSGDYLQGSNRLRLGDKFCCLGVLCDLHAKETNTAWGFAGFNNDEYDGASHTLPKSVRDWAGLGTCSGVRPDENAPSLTEINDNGTPFSKIADLIESEF